MKYEDFPEVSKLKQEIDIIKKQKLTLEQSLEFSVTCVGHHKNILNSFNVPSELFEVFRTLLLTNKQKANHLSKWYGLSGEDLLKN